MSIAMMWVIGIFSLVALSAASAAADGLTWTAPAECPDTPSLRARIEQRLGSGAVIGPVAIAVERTGDAMVATIELHGATRTVTSSSCDELADAVAMIVARAANDRIAAAELVGSPPADSGRRVEVGEPARVEISRPTRGARWGIGARLATVSGVGAVPGLGLAGEADVIARRGTLVGELGYTRWASGSAHGASELDRMQLGLASVVARVGWRSDAMPIGAWLVGEVGSMTAIGSGAVDPRAVSGRWVAAGAGVGIAWPLLTSFAVRGAFEVVDAVERTRFQLADGTMLYEPARLAATVSLGGEVTWR